MLVPNNFPNNERMQIAAFYQPHQQVGGDYYDVITLNENEIVFCVADVSGKGVSAAFLMSNFQANLNALVNYTDYSLDAGHNPPILMQNGELFLLENGCIGLGMLDEIPTIKEGNIKLKKETTVVCYTDGLTEVENEKKKQFGVEFLGEIILSYPEVGMAELNTRIINTMNTFRGKAPLIDDTALLSCRFRI